MTGPPAEPATPGVALLFPGQGSQHTRMGAGLYRREPVFTAALDAVLAGFGAQADQLRTDWLAGQPAVDIDDVRRAQPLLFAVDYALGRLVLSWGVRPVALLGHSAGELVAATLAGVFTLTEAVEIVSARVRHASRVPPGGMLAVAASEAALRPYLAGGVAVAAVNAPQQTMLAGPAAPLRSVAAALDAAGFVHRPVPATSPFHCPAMAPAAAATEPVYARAGRRPPALPLYSAYTGDRLTRAQAADPGFWARQLTDTVYFGPSLDRLLADCGRVLLVEAGPRQTLTAFAARHPAVRSGASAVVPMLPARGIDPARDLPAVQRAATQIRQAGLTAGCSRDTPAPAGSR